MKKIILSVSCLLASVFSFAGNNKEQGKDVLENGFYLNLGVGLPKASVTSYGDALSTSLPFAYGSESSLGTQFNVEVGNQFYFVKTGNVGFGMKCGWAQLGFSSFKNIYKGPLSADNKGYGINLNVIKFGPQVTYAINDDFGIDGYFDIAPAAQYTSVKVSTGTGDIGQWGAGVTFAPGLRARYSMLALGFDYNFGNIYGSGTMPGSDTDYSLKQKVNSLRFYLGFQF